MGSRSAGPPKLAQSGEWRELMLDWDLAFAQWHTQTHHESKKLNTLHPQSTFPMQRRLVAQGGWAVQMMTPRRT